MATADFDELISLARAGGRREKEALLKRLRPLACRWALVWTGSPDVAEDAAQKVLIKVDTALTGYVPNGKAMTWLYRITRNVLVDLDRERARRNRLRDRIAMDRLAQDAACGRDLRPYAESLLSHLMEKLSPQQRAVLDLVDLQGFDTAEVAEMLKVSPATVRVHLHRARGALRTHSRRNSPTEIQNDDRAGSAES